MKEFYAHPTAVIDAGAFIGEGSKVWHFCHISTGARLGERCILGQNVFIDSGVSIGTGCKIQNNVSIYKGVALEDFVFCGPSCVFTNVVTPRAGVERKSEFAPTVVKRGATIGANATVVCGCTIGEFALIGAGCVVTKNVPPHALVVGVPATVIGWVCECGEVLCKSGELGMQTCNRCTKTYEVSSSGISTR
jgi:UDP-2-acetamido-3-amino-2,3-dideoxy-glucuronate N-acetyltransferase